MTGVVGAEPIILRLPIMHARDWVERYDNPDDEGGVEVVGQTARTITLSLSVLALCDLISDSAYYAEEMGPENTGDFDYRPRARTCLAAIERLGVQYVRRGFSITLLAVP